MPLIDSRRNRVLREFSPDELREQAAYMRGLNEIALCAAGSGHSGGTLSIMDIAAALYLRVAKHDPHQPRWPGRDRVVWSAGHKAPALYTALAASGYFDERELVKLRQLESPLQGHPHWRDLPGVEFSTGSLGQGFSLGVGSALAAKLDHLDYRVFVISTDGEQQEGSIWEAAMSAAHFRLDNLILIVDMNGLQIDGLVAQVMGIEPLADKYRAFGWQVETLDGHDMDQVVAALEKARNANDSGKPVVLLCTTVKGRGVSFMENQVEWHGKAPNREQLEKLLHELGVERKLDADALLSYGADHARRVASKVNSGLPKFSRSYWWNAGERMKVEMIPTRKGFGKALDKYGDDPRVVCLGADISDSICISDFHKQHPERRNRFISVGIAEQNATTIAAGLAKEGKLPVFGTYGVFASARNLDQLRVSVCYGNLNVFVAGAHGGISVGPDGATHQELEAMFQICGLPNMKMAVPVDALETEKMTRLLLFDSPGPKYLRFAREGTPVVTAEDTPLSVGEALVVRYRGEHDNFKDAFEWKAASAYRTENENLVIISCGPETAEAMRAAYILKEEKDIETRVLHLPTVKPLDEDAILRAVAETRAVITAEEHQLGGLGNQVAGLIMEHLSPSDKIRRFARIGVRDRFGESGQPWQLIIKFGLAAEHLAQKALQLIS